MAKKAKNKEAEALKGILKAFEWYIDGNNARAPISVKLSPEQMALLDSVIHEDDED